MQRSDTDIHKDIVAELHWDPSLRHDDVAVAVRDGVVTLAGLADSYADKWKAEQIAIQDAPWVPLYFQKDLMLIKPAITGYRDLRTRRAAGVRFVDFELLIDSRVSFEKAHEVTELVKERIREAFPSVVINAHAEPVCVTAAASAPAPSS